MAFRRNPAKNLIAKGKLKLEPKPKKLQRKKNCTAKKKMQRKKKQQPKKKKKAKAHEGALKSFTILANQKDSVNISKTSRFNQA